MLRGLFLSRGFSGCCDYSTHFRGKVSSAESRRQQLLASPGLSSFAHRVWLPKELCTPSGSGVTSFKQTSWQRSPARKMW